METTDYEHGVVPQDQRKGWLSIATVWIAIGIDLSGAFLGVALASGMAFWPAMGATILGSLLLGLLAMACAYVGASTGLSTAVISRAVFGRIGGAVLALAISISLVGWFAVQAGFFGTNAQIAFTEFTGIDVPVQIFTGVGGVLMAITAFWGYRSINRLSSLAVPLLLVRGRMSDLLSEEGAREMLELVPHAEFADVAGAGHMVAGDRNDAFNDAVLRFLDALP